jgi:phage tail sheath protein FI
MLNPKSPGVYVEEAPPLARPIAGAGTSTAGFIGIVPDSLTLPSKRVVNEAIGIGAETRPDGSKTDFPLAEYPVQTTTGFEMRINGKPDPNAKLTNVDASKVSRVTFSTPPPVNSSLTGDYVATPTFSPLPAGQVALCTNFGEFTKSFGDFSTDPHHQNLAHAVFGFFNNGGSRCYVMRQKSEGDISQVTLAPFESIDEIAIVAAPGVIDRGVRSAIIAHCKVATQDRVAIFDSPEIVETNNSLDLTLLDPSNPSHFLPDNSDYAAFYFPWTQVFDPATNGLRYVPPSGHIAGIYADVDAKRGVHKAPANQALLGVVGLKYQISRAQQEGLNPRGINCIRTLNNSILVWGARTIGGDANGEFRYISTRRYFNYLRKSIEQGTQFVVFEPNSPSLWERIKRSVGDFLLNEWRGGALFGDTPKQAFFVRCDEETNPPEVREAGRVVTEVGVAIVKPAEFVIFRIQQQTGG